MRLGTVCVLVSGPSRPDLLRDTRAALAVQERPPQRVLDAAAGDANLGVDAVLAAGADWIWLLDGVTIPAQGALAAFEGGLERLAGLPEPLVLASKVLDASGGVHRDALPRHEIFEKQRTVDACERGLVHLRATPSGSVLIRRAAFERFAPPRDDLPPGWAIFELTARILQSWEDTGYLVPESIAVRRLAPRPSGRAGGALRSRARLLTGDAWTTTERLWETYLVVEGAVTDGRETGAPGRRFSRMPQAAIATLWRG